MNVVYCSDHRNMEYVVLLGGPTPSNPIVNFSRASGERDSCSLNYYLEGMQSASARATIARGSQERVNCQGHVVHSQATR
jgi:hypothetical protein